MIKVAEPVISIASDYAQLAVGKFSFYYGYEETVTVDGEDEWAFTASLENKEIMRLSTTDLDTHNSSGDVIEYLLLGIGEYLKEIS